MRKNVILALAILGIGLVSSCRKEEINPASPLPQKQAVSETQNQKIVQNCFYTPFQQTGTNEWSVNFQGVDLKFSNLHIRSDGKLYGRFMQVSNGIILNGGDSYNQRDFGAEVTLCSQSTQTIDVFKTSSFVSIPSNTIYTSGNPQTLNLAIANGLALLNENDEVDVIIHNTTAPQSTMVTTTKYKKVTTTSCANSKLMVGKLVAQGVVYNLTTGAYTFTGLGVASICYPDPMVGFI